VRRPLIAIAVLALATACASPGLPPGGPTISSFPRVIATVPDTNAVNVRPNRVLVRYDDVIGEQAAGGNLSRIVLISPWDGEPRVDWRRTGMAIRPRGSWRTNTAYTITIIPGVADLKGAASPYGYLLRFSTGATIPEGTIRGVAFDWIAARPVARATVLATDVTDTTLTFITVADSTGRFELTTVPPGRYVVRAIDEKTPNRMLDPREAWDSATVTLTDSARTDLYTFVHDTLPVRIAELRLSDSATVTLILDKPLLPGAPLPVSGVRVVATDSSVIPVVAVLTAAEARVEQERADSIRRARDTTAGARLPGAPTLPRRTIDPTQRRDTVAALVLPTSARLAPATELVVRLARTLAPGGTYRITLTGLRNLLGVEGSATRVLIVPRAIAPDSIRTTPPADTRDSTPSPRPATPPPTTPVPATRPPTPDTRAPAPATRPSAPVTRPPAPVTRPPAPVTRPPAPLTRPPSLSRR